MLKITQPHLSMNNVFPPINTHSRPPSEDLHGVTSTGITDIHSASKHQQIRRQQATIDQQRRSPLRIIYRSSDYAWNDHANKTNASNQPLRAPSPIKTKLTTSARHLANGILHEGNTAQSMLHLPTTSSPIVNQDFHIPSANQSRHTSRLQRTNSHLDKSPVPHNYGLPVRSESYRSSRLDYGLRPRHTSSKQRTYVNSKTSFHDGGGGGSGNNQDENTYNQSQTQQMNFLSSTQRLHGSSFDLTTSRKSLSPNKSNTFNLLHAQNNNYHTSTQEVQRTNSTRFITRDTNSKEQLIQTTKYRQTANGSAAQTTVSSTTSAAIVVPPGERHPSAQSYKSRDPNVSYAYTDVKKYIEENELMSSEKEQIIRNWILEVEKHRHQLQKIE